MKKLIFTGLVGLSLLLPTNLLAETTNNTKTELSNNKPKKNYKKNKRASSNKNRQSKTYAQNSFCTYNGHKLYIGKRGGCYYMTGSSKQYVERSYCLSCN